VVRSRSDAKFIEQYVRIDKNGFVETDDSQLAAADRLAYFFSRDTQKYGRLFDGEQARQVLKVHASPRVLENVRRSV
jgi:hypothetical protein